MRCSVIQGRFRAGSPPFAVIQRHGGGEAFQVPATMAARLGMPGGGHGGGQPLPPTIQRHMEGVLGVPLGDVRVHVGPEASALGAVAFTMGSTIHFAPGRYDPGSRQGLQLLGHELAHVVQQRQGRVANPFGSGIAVVSDRALEAQADAIGIKAAMASGAAPPLQMKAGAVPMRAGAAGGGQVAQPFYGLGALAGYASSAVGYVASAVAAHPYVALFGLGAAAASYYFLQGDTPGMRHNVRIARPGERRPARLRHTPPQYSITLSVYKHGRDDVGHAFITIQMDGIVTMAMGLSPRDLPTHDLPGMLRYLFNTMRGQPGRIYIEFDSLRDPNLQRQTWDISDAQAIRAMRKMNADRRLNLDTALNMQEDYGWGGGPGYNAFSNCASWALDVLEEAGIDASHYRGIVDRPGAFYNAL